MKLTYWKNKYGLKKAIWQTLLLIEKHLRNGREMKQLQIYKYKSQNLRLELSEATSGPFDPSNVKKVFFFSSIERKDFWFNDFYEINLDFERGLHLFKDVKVNSAQNISLFLLSLFLLFFIDRKSVV